MSPNWTSTTVKVVSLLAVCLTSIQFLYFLGHLYTRAPLPAPPPPPLQRPLLAKQSLAAELLARTPSRTKTVVPKIFHQSWKSLELPAKFQQWSLSCRRKHPDWEWVVWTDEDNLRLVRQHFPWFEDVYNGLPGVIYRADMARHLYMYIYGGVYADLDTECLQPTENLERTYGPLFGPSTTPRPDLAIFGRMGNKPEFDHAIPNAWMAATPGHPLFLSAVRRLIDAYNSSKSEGTDIGNPEDATGPIALRESITQYVADLVRHGPTLDEKVASLAAAGPFAHDQSENHQVLLLPSHFVYPYSWAYGGEHVRNICWVLQDSFDADKCKAKLKTEQAGSISITYWSHTHTPSGHDEGHMQHISERRRL
ncbi:hypothetical protein E4U41_007413 [Claviceps citrina]|nr:hypothetical protein E4U41_007413 [Claviceps citrina]